MRFTLLFLRRPRGTLAVCACLLLLGVFALKQMPVNLYPHVEYPVLTISTELSESSPEELEATVTKPIEEAIADIPGLKKIEAVSREGESQVTLQFHHDQKIAEKAMEVRSRIRRIFPLLPKDARFPVISRFDPSDTPVVVLAVTGDASLETVGHWVNEYLKPQLSRIDGVATVRVAGAPRRQILVECDTGRLQAQSLTISDVVAAITTSHASIPGGIVVQSGKNLSVITQGKLETPEDVSTVSLKLEQDGPVLRIGEIARVRLGSEERKEITRFNGRDLITVLVYRSTAADLRAIWKSISEKLDQIPHGSEFTPKIDVILNQAEEVERILARLWVILGITAAIMPLVLFAFLRTVRSTIVVLLAIPFSMLTTILAMQLLGVSLDMMSLGGLTLGIGILVDNAIVVAESISRRRSEGNSETDAVVLGTGDVAVPVILATAATIVVFLPVLFVSREIGLLFKGFAWTVGVGLFFSMIAAMILVPVLLRYIGGQFKQSDGSRSLDAALSLRYGRLVNFLEAHRLVVVSSAVCLLILGVFLSGDLSYRRALITEVRSVRVVMVLAPGTATERTAAEALAVEQQLMKLPFVKGVHSDTRDNQAILTVSLKAHEEGGAQDAISSRGFRQALKARDQDAQFHVLPVGGQGEATKISMNLEGPTSQGLRSLQDKVRLSLATISGIDDVMVHHRNRVPVVELKLDRELLGASAIDPKDLAYHVRGHFTGPVSAKIMTGEKLTRVRVRALRDPQHGLEPLQPTAIRTSHMEMVPFSEFCLPSIAPAEGELRRLNRKPVIPISMMLDKRSDPLSIAAGIQTAMSKIEMPPQYGYHFGDEIKEIRRTRNEMFMAVAAGLIFIYLILIVATESLLQPLLIMIALPFSVCGAIIALTLLKIPVSLPVYVGIMILCGLAVNVNVVMVYTISGFRREGTSLDEAVSRGSRRRLRPILMTVLTTSLAALPMLLDRGEGSSLWSPFALTLASGIVTGTLFSLVLTPLLYKHMERLKERIGRIKAYYTNAHSKK